MLDDVDRRLLRLYQSDPDLNLADLATQAGLSAAKATRRLDKLAQSGVIEGVEAVIDWAALGYAVEVSLRVTLDKTQTRAFDNFIAAARAVPQVIEIQTFLGRVDVRLSVLARDMADYQQLYRDHILTLPHIADIEALMLVSRIKDETGVPL
ncbi:MAG: Lrp/AsnC family transcriptional regulator [Paracoccaceae bacterium]|jgi:Lrp/AsnC family transcriptional regulator|nr:Lrp/AsnC family transcriptional regulator [Paracoccaceae bacterium]